MVFWKHNKFTKTSAKEATPHHKWIWVFYSALHIPWVERVIAQAIVHSSSLVTCQRKCCHIRPQHRQPVHTSTVQQWQPVHTSTVQHRQPVHTSTVQHRQPVHTSTVQQWQPVHTSTLQHRQPVIIVMSLTLWTLQDQASVFLLVQLWFGGSK